MRSAKALVRTTPEAMFPYRYTFVISTLSLAGTLWAQAYIPLLHPTATWHDETYTAYPGPNVSISSCYRYYLDGDTMVDDVEYQILRTSGLYSYENTVTMSSPLLTWYTRVLVAFVREDLEDRRVYIREPGWPYERLLYDFGADVGPYPSTYRYQATYVTDVDTIELSDGPHRRLHFSSAEQIIEGIGGTAGFLIRAPGGYQYDFGWIACHTVDGVPNYSASSDDCTCDSNVGSSEAQGSPMRIGPIPTTGPCHLQGAPRNAPFSIRTMDGRLVGSGVCMADGSADLDLADLPSGIYLVALESAQGSMTLKVVRE